MTWGLLSFYLQRIKAVDRRGMVTSPMLSSECMCGHMCMTHLLHLGRGDPEIFL